MGGGAKSQSTSYSGSGQAWAQPLAQAGASSVQSVFNQNQPGLQQITDQARGTIPSLLSQFTQGQATAGQANKYNSDVLSGKYMSGNPYIANILSQLDRGVGDQVNSQFEQSGRYGSGAQADVLSRNLADANSNVLYQNYTDEMNRMGQASQQAGAANVANTGLLQSLLGTSAALPYTGSTSLADSLGALFSGGTEKSTQTGQNPIWGAIGAGLGAAGTAAAGGAFSDRRLKTNIELVSRDPDGLGWYNWNWKSSPNGEKAHGVIADEVEKLRPWALGESRMGYRTVNYAAL